MDKQFLDNLANLEKAFASISDPKTRYIRLMKLGEELPALPEIERTEKNRVQGCQSTLYLHTYLEDTNANQRLCFHADADALISKGLVAILILAYQGATALTLLQHPPHFLEKWQIPASLSLNRSHGLAHIYLKMKTQTIECLSRAIPV